MLDEIGIDWNKDTFDEGDHLNYYGSKKLTDYLSEYLKEECDLTDHRGDPEFESWNELLPLYEQEIVKMEGTSYSRLEKERKEKMKNQ